MLSLLWLFAIPFIAAFTLLLLPHLSNLTLKRIAIGLSLIPLAMLIIGHTNWIGSEVIIPWISPLSINFHLTIDSLSLLFLYLTAIVIPISLFATPNQELTSPHAFYFLVLLLEGLLIGFFTTRDLALFTIFWEAMLLPLYFIINLWGGARRQAASLKFLIYLLAGSALLVVAVLALYFTAASNQGTGTFNLDALASIAESTPYAYWICAIFLLAFAVKTPLFPFHAWLPDAYYQAPMSGTILLSAILSKAGIYGIVRIALGLFPTILMKWNPLLLGLAISGVFYGGLAAWRQNDFKRLIAYSSFSHVNFVLAGLFIWSQTAQEGAILQALNHGITIAALFLVAGWLQNRIGTTSMNEFSGVAEFFPRLCWLTLVFVLSSVALPGTNNFIGELLVLFGLFGKSPELAAILGLTVILSVMYMLRWMQNVYFNPSNFRPENKSDIKGKDLAVALPLVALILWIGIYPDPLLKQIEPITAKIFSHTNLEER